MILVGIAGPHLTVTGAVLGDRLTTERLTDYVYLGPHPSREGRSGLDEGIRRVARILRALAISTALLKDHYSGLDRQAILDSPDAPLPPHYQNFTTDGVTYKLKYKRRLSDDQGKAVFVASIEPASQVGGPDVVVKFAHSYCKDAHMLLAQRSFAPRLRYCEEVESVGMHVVVMDLAVGKHAKATLNDKSLVRKLQTAIQALHDAGFVHGDLREPNILVTEGDVKIIDFDWCGKDGEVRYPASINLGGSLGWDRDVARGGLIKKEHDQRMFCRLTGLEWGAHL